MSANEPLKFVWVLTCIPSDEPPYITDITDYLETAKRLGNEDAEEELIWRRGPSPDWDHYWTSNKNKNGVMYSITMTKVNTDHE